MTAQIVTQGAWPAMTQFQALSWPFMGTTGASGEQVEQREPVLHGVIVAVFAMAAGFTASGIIASAYRLLAKDPASSLGRAAYVAVMIFAGPTVLFENAVRAWREKSCSGAAFWIATVLAGYWSLALGLLVIQLGLALKAL